MILDFYWRFGTSVSLTRVKQSEKNEFSCDRLFGRISVPFFQTQTFQEKLFLLLTDISTLIIDPIFKGQSPQKEQFFIVANVWGQIIGHIFKSQSHSLDCLFLVDGTDVLFWNVYIELRTHAAPHSRRPKSCTYWPFRLSSFIHDRSDRHVKALLQGSEHGSVEVTGNGLRTRGSTVGRYMCFPFCRRRHTESVSQPTPYPDYCRLFPQHKNRELQIDHVPTFTQYIDFLRSFTSSPRLHLCHVLIKLAKNFIYCTYSNVTCMCSRMCYVESFAWLKIPFWFLWNITALYMILMDFIYIFLYSSDSSSYFPVKHLLFTWLQYCSTPTEIEAFDCLTHIQNTRSVILSLFLLVFFSFK
jgi:hypothetical protein